MNKGTKVRLNIIILLLFMIAVLVIISPINKDTRIDTMLLNDSITKVKLDTLQIQNHRHFEQGDEIYLYFQLGQPWFDGVIRKINKHVKEDSR